MGAILSGAYAAVQRAAAARHQPLRPVTAGHKLGAHVPTGHTPAEAAVYLDVQCEDIASTVTLAVDYEPSELPRRTSGYAYSLTGDPGDPGCDALIDIRECWVRGIDIVAVLSPAALDDLQRQALKLLEPA